MCVPSGSAAVTPVLQVLTGALRRDQERYELRAATDTATAGATAQTSKDDASVAQVWVHIDWKHSLASLLDII